MTYGEKSIICHMCDSRIHHGENSIVCNKCDSSPAAAGDSRIKTYSRRGFPTMKTALNDVRAFRSHFQQNRPASLSEFILSTELAVARHGCGRSPLNKPPAWNLGDQFLSSGRKTTDKPPGAILGKKVESVQGWPCTGLVQSSIKTNSKSMYGVPCI
jgi:hypothetical protein